MKPEFPIFHFLIIPDPPIHRLFDFNVFYVFDFLISHSARVVGVGPGPAGQAAAGAIYVMFRKPVIPAV